MLVESREHLAPARRSVRLEEPSRDDADERLEARFPRHANELLRNEARLPRQAEEVFARGGLAPELVLEGVDGDDERVIVEIDLPMRKAEGPIRSRGALQERIDLEGRDSWRAQGARDVDGDPVHVDVHVAELLRVPDQGEAGAPSDADDPSEVAPGDEEVDIDERAFDGLVVELPDEECALDGEGGDAGSFEEIHELAEGVEAQLEACPGGHLGGEVERAHGPRTVLDRCSTREKRSRTVRPPFETSLRGGAMRRSRLFLVGLTAGLSGLLVMGCGGDDKPQPQQPPADAGPDGDTTPGDCSAIAFAKPLPGAKLLTTDDLDGDCSNGVQYDVEIATSMADGSEAILSGTESQLTATVSGGVARFENVTFPIGETTLSVQVGDSASCRATTKVQVSCGDAPSCVITEPSISPTHPKVGLADNVAAPGNPLQAKVEVTTNVEDGRLVPLEVGGQVVASAVVINGKATWPAVTLGPDGSRQVKATCTNAAGASSSDTKTFVIDGTPPDLDVTGAVDGQHFEPIDSADPSSPDVVIRVCGTTSAADALDLKQGPAPNPDNFCVGIGTATPECAPAKASTGNGACVDVVCPGAAPFDVTATLYDEAGNPTKKTISGLTCVSENPSVQIVEPVDGTGADVTTHILAANSSQPRRDQDPAKAGAQYTVTACTDAEDGKGTLKVGLADGTLTTWNSTPVDAEPAQPSDDCPVGYGYVLRFTDADLPDSAVDAAGELATATRLVVEVQRLAMTGTSPAVDVWVDSTPPALATSSPDPLCGASQVDPTTWTTDVELESSTDDVTFAVTSSGVRKEYAAASYEGGKLLYEDVAFEPGPNEITAIAREPSGNESTLESPCTVQIGNPPVLTWLAPTPDQNLCAAGNTLESCVPDTEEGTAGWQGELVVRVMVDGAPATAGDTVTLTWDSEELQATVDTDGIARFSPSIDDGNGSGRVVPITASFTADGFGTGKATVSPIVDAERPQPPTNLAATIKDRRQTTIRLDWTAGQDGTASTAAHGYDLRIASTPLDDAGFDAATSIPFAGAPAAPGDADGIDVRDLLVETDYFFALKAVDRVGNRSDLVATNEPARAELRMTVLQSPDPAGQDAFGYWNDGSGDLNGDGRSDLLVSPFYGNKVFAYFGATDFSATEPSIVFQGDAGFGASVIFAGDVDGDGLEDVAISSLDEAKVYVFKGRDVWPATVQASEADYVIDAGAYASSGFGFQLARLGDFDGDGVDDFAISAQFHDGNRGHVIIVRGSKSFPQAITLSDVIGSRALVIEGEEANAELGANLIGIGKFYGGLGNGVVVSAPGAASYAGRVYAFRGGQTGTNGVISAANATHTIEGFEAGTNAGLSLGVVGPVAGSFGFLIGNPLPTSAPGNAYYTVGQASSGPFGPPRHTLTCSTAPGVQRDGFGNVTLGGGFSGRTTYVSLIGDATPDLLVAASREGNGSADARLYLIDGRKLPSLPESADVVTAADVIVSLPSGWIGTSSFNTLLRDVDGDGYPDFAIGEYNEGTPGRVAIFW